MEPEYTQNIPRGIPSLQFNPDNHPHSTLKAFKDFTEQYNYRYEAQYPLPQKYVMDNEFAIWKAANGDTDPTAERKHTLQTEWISKDKVRKLLGFFASPRLIQDWRAAEPDATNVSWETFIEKMETYYKPTENRIIRNFEFRQLSQRHTETFSAFCNRVEEAGKNCYFCECTEATCSARQYAIRDQIVIGTHNEIIREKAMLKDWNLKDLRSKGMKYESVAVGEEKLVENLLINLVHILTKLFKRIKIIQQVPEMIQQVPERMSEMIKNATVVDNHSSKGI